MCSLEAHHGWVLYHDSQGYPYYHNAASGESEWALSPNPQNEHATHVNAAIVPEGPDPGRSISRPYSTRSQGCAVVTADTEHNEVREFARRVTDFRPSEDIAQLCADRPDVGSKEDIRAPLSADENSSHANGELSDPDDDETHQSSDDSDDAALLEFDDEYDNDSEARAKFSAMLATPEGQAALQAEMRRVDKLIERKRHRDYERWRRNSRNSVAQYTMRTEPRAAMVVRRLIFVPVLLLQRIFLLGVRRMHHFFGVGHSKEREKYCNTTKAQASTV